MNERELQDFLAKGDNAPRDPPARLRRILEWSQAQAELSNLYDPQYRAPYGRGSAVAFTPTRKEPK